MLASFRDLTISSFGWDKVAAHHGGARPRALATPMAGAVVVPCPEAAFLGLFGRDPYAYWLDSSLWGMALHAPPTWVRAPGPRMVIRYYTEGRYRWPRRRSRVPLPGHLQPS